MNVQIKPSQPKAQHNGLSAIEEQILDAPKGDRIVAIVTYEREKRVEDEKLDETYPVLGIKHIEPILNAKDLKAVLAAQEAAYKLRTGEEALDFSGIDSEPPAGDDDGAAAFPAGGKK